MQKVIVASTNPVKIKVAEKAFAAVFPNETFEIIGISTASGVPDQPFGDETRQGARNRLAVIKKSHPEADYWISQEGGLYRDSGEMYNRAWIAMSDKGGFITESTTAHFRLPKQVAAYVEEGMELGHADDKFFGTTNSKQSTGHVGILTDGIIDRTEYYLHAAIIALSELKHQEWYI